MLSEPTVHPSAYVADTARIFGSVTVGRLAVVMFGAAGTPARPVRSLTTDEIAAQDRGVDEYLAFAEQYRQRQ